MISAFIAGRPTKWPEFIGGRYQASLAGIADDRSVRIVCRRRHAEQLLRMPLGTPVSIAGLLEVTPVLNEKGEPRAFLCLQVTAILDVPQPVGLLNKLFASAK